MAEIEPSATSAVSGSLVFRTGLDGPDPFDSGPLIDVLVDNLPEFVSTLRDLFDECDDDPGEPAILMELADFVDTRLRAQAVERHVLERACRLLEAIVESLGDDEVGCELVGIAFFDSVPFESQHALIPWLGPRSRAVLEALDAPPVE